LVLVALATTSMIIIAFLVPHAILNQKLAQDHPARASG